MKNKLVIFDLDGVLVDACDWHFEALNEALGELCKYRITDEDHVKIFNGIPTRKKLEILTSRGTIPADLHQKIYEKKQSITVKKIERLAKRDDTKISMIKFLKNSGCFVACFTNSIRETAELMLEKSGILNLFDMVVTNEDVRNSKPSPEGYNLIIEKFNFHKKDVIIIEDSPKGLIAARATGAKVIAVENATFVNIDLFKGLI